MILSANGEATADVLALRTVLGRFAAGDGVSLKIKRDAHETELQVQLAAAPADAPADEPEPRKVEP